MKLRRKAIEKINEIKGWCFEKENKIDKRLAIHIQKRKKERRHELPISGERGNISKSLQALKVQ